MNKNLTVVTGIWDLKRHQAGQGFKRAFSHYIENFKKLLKTDYNLLIFIEKEKSNNFFDLKVIQKFDFQIRDNHHDLPIFLCNDVNQEVSRFVFFRLPLGIHKWLS